MGRSIALLRVSPTAVASISPTGQFPRTECSDERLRDDSENLLVDVIHAACTGNANHDHSRLTNNVWIRLAPYRLLISNRGCWTQEQFNGIRHLGSLFPERAAATAVDAELREQQGTMPMASRLVVVVLGWTALWVLFLFVFPWSPTIQAIFFWNPRVRALFSLWFVPLLLLIVPPLRRRLLAPFRESLLASARLKEFDQLRFFDQMPLRIDNQVVSSKEVLKRMRGAVVVQADAGLGKTSLLRWIAANSRLPVAFLSARDCASGVDIAIARIMHNIQEVAFVRSMIHSRSLIVIVDGLNEVSADTREQIGSFARDLSNGDIFVATQPIEWRAPPSAHLVQILPLSRDKAYAFLISRPAFYDCEQSIHGDRYSAAVQAFLSQSLDRAPDDESRRIAATVLSNPFDLALAADLLSRGVMPTATALIDEAFRLAVEGSPGEPGYREVVGRAFPIVEFGRLAIAMRCEDRVWFKPEEFPAELPFLMRQKLIVQRAVGGVGVVEERRQFRHDRVWDFFIAACFGSDPDIWVIHMSDPRFRGAYLRMAETWPENDAAQVRDRLIVVAAETSDHTTSDEFIKRLERRKARKTSRSRSANSV